MKDVKRVKDVKTLLCLAVLLATGCGGTEQGTGSGTPEPGGAPAATASSKVVSHETLLTFLPVVPGLTKGTPQGTTDTTESVSHVQVNYDMKDSAGVSIEIMDTSRNQMMLEPMLAMTKPGYVLTQGIATTRATTVSGFPAYEEWAADARNGVVAILVEGRFTIAVTGNYVPDVATLRKVAEAIDLKKLAALK